LVKLCANYELHSDHQQFCEVVQWTQVFSGVNRVKAKFHWNQFLVTFSWRRRLKCLKWL